MFLPVLLVRDYGLWAWFVFAIPNVVGAAAMGWVLRDADASLRLQTKHLPAVVAFSLGTIAFHVFFLFCIAGPIAGSWFVVPIALLSMLLAWLLSHHVHGGWLIAAAVVLAVSVAALVVLGFSRAIALPAQQGQLPTLNILWLLPVCVFGFLLCPYLDVTFHRARQALGPADGRLAFGVGFGGFFLLMIVITLLYAPLLIVRGAALRDVDAAPPATFAVWIVAIHMAVQAGFTMVAHGRYAGRRLEALGMEMTTIFVLAALGLLIGAMIVSSRVIDYRGLSGPELAYRFFMAFYGLVFPAYVWICMVPTRASDTVPRRAIVTFAAATLIAAPMFWMGFIERRMFWLVPGVAIVLLAQLVVTRTGPRPNQETLVRLRSDPAEATKNFLTASK